MNALTIPTATTPEAQMDALAGAVGQRFDWRLLTGGADDAPRFVIEKRVRYEFVRGWSSHAVYRISGQFEPTANGAATLHYRVSGSLGVPMLHAALHVGVLLVFALLLAGVVRSPGIDGNPIGTMMVAGLMVLAVAYAVYAYRRYQAHLDELHRFMRAFASHIA